MVELFEGTTGPVITPDDSVGTHKTHSIPTSLSVEEITKRLGFGPNVEDNPAKVEYLWAFRVDGSPCAIWDYRGVRWSAYDPDGVLGRIFPEIRKGW